MTWEFRYRSPRTMETVQIETFGDDPEDDTEAKALANAYLARLSNPGLRFVYVKPAVVARSREFPELVARFGQTRPAAPPREAPPENDEFELPDRVPPMSGELMPPTPGDPVDEPAPVHDGFDDEMSGPRVKTPRGKPTARVGQ